MGSIARVNICYGDLSALISSSNSRVFGTFMDGESVYEQDLPDRGVLILGNEGHGISKSLDRIINQRISIPQFGNTSAESLNVTASATAIFFLNEIRGNPLPKTFIQK